MEEPLAARILVVDDEPPIVDVLVYNLQRANYEVVVARDGEEALAAARREKPDLIVLDLMLPRLDGLEVCRALRREQDVPIIMLTARDSEVDRVVGLELGADDYVVKPFSVRELMARIKSVLRRTMGHAPAPNGAALRAGPLAVDPASREARWDGALLDLTTLEFDLLLTLVRHAGQVLSREQLLQQVWGYDYFGDLRAVDAAVKRLRSKLRAAAPQAEAVETVRGVGYKLVVWPT
ncbi:MAG: response regulator transcription factor [Anaerolineae bacterium]|nr:response regulator transcription factor [Anaerolineae bacterium]